MYKEETLHECSLQINNIAAILGYITLGINIWKCERSIVSHERSPLIDVH